MKVFRPARVAGRLDEAEVALAGLIEGYGQVAAYQIAQTYAGIGQPDEAFRWLETSYEQRDGGLVLSRVDPQLAPLHDDPRWSRFLDKMGLAD